MNTIKLAFFFVLMINCGMVISQESTCYGTTSKGRLENGVALPITGKNYTSYSLLSRLLDRSYVHSTVRDIMVATYSVLERKYPLKVYKYGETGHEAGGKFKPHKTHQNGLSVDFMVPVIDENGRSVHLPTHPFNKYGYSIEFNDVGKFDNYHIDYEAMAAHIVELDKTAKKMNRSIWRVIFDPRLQKYLKETKHGDYLEKNITFSIKQSWVRHDEHYHIDFEVVCDKE